MPINMVATAYLGTLVASGGLIANIFHGKILGIRPHKKLSLRKRVVKSPTSRAMNNDMTVQQVVF